MVICCFGFAGIFEMMQTTGFEGKVTDVSDIDFHL
jgi:hypothetical protein